jgi:hypothetical protein
MLDGETEDKSTVVSTVSKPEHAQTRIIPIDVLADWLGNTFSKSTSDVNMPLVASKEQILTVMKIKLSIIEIFF